MSDLRSLLSACADGSAPPAIALSGRRGGGKSTLLQRALTDEQMASFVFTARRDESSEKALKRFLEELEREEQRLDPTRSPLDEPLPPSPIPAARSWQGAFELALRTLSSSASSRGAGVRACFAIDELPWLMASEKKIEAALSAALEAGGRHDESAGERGGDGGGRQADRGGGGDGDGRRVAVALLGAHRHAMASLQEDGRPLQSLLQRLQVDRLDPFQLGEAIGRPALDTLDAWSVLGGLPELVERWQKRDTLHSYLSRELRNPVSPLIVAGERIAAQELPPRSAALAVLYALGEGLCDFTSIFNRTQLGRTAISGALHRHVLRGNIWRYTPFSLGESAKLSCYGISDPYLRFWLRFIGPGLPELRRGASELVMQRIQSGWETYRHDSIEPLVWEGLRLRLPSEELGGASEVGLHWTRSTQHSQPTIVGCRPPLSPGAVAFVGLIEWRKGSPFAARRAANLARMRRKVPYADESTLLVGVSREGFEQDAKLDVKLGPEDLLEAWAKA